MACVALTSLIGTINIEFFVQRRASRLSVDRLLLMYFVDSLCRLQAFLQKTSSSDGDAVRDLEIQIRDFAIKAEDDIEIQLSNILLAKDGEHEEEAWKELRQTLRKAAGKAAEIEKELFQIINGGKEHQTEREKEREMIFNALTSIWKTIDKMEHMSMVSLHDKDKRGIKSNFLEKLSSLQHFLHNESNGGCTKDDIKDLETKIKHIVIKAKDEIQILLRNFLPVGDTKVVSQKLYQTMKEATESAAELLNIINSRRSNEEVDDYEAAAAAAANVVESDGSSSTHGFLKPEGRMVGRHHDCTVINDQLCSSLYELKIISIVGMVGIGKTTVARNVYEDPSVASHFDIRAWVTIPPPQHYNKSGMLRQLLQSITPVKEQNVIKKGSTPYELEIQVREYFVGKKYLIVLDNMMTDKPLTYITKCVVPNYINGSCILRTTREDNRHNWPEYTHKMTLLDPKESWELFCNILSIDEEHLAPKFEKIRNHVVEKCDGLPQLIVEVAKRLSKCNNIQQGWKKIEKELKSLGLLDRNALSVSYNMLPHHLKVCFLYFGVFPKRKKILVKMLIRLWIAEEFLKPLKHKELEDEAYEYLEELTDRSLLLIED